MQGQKNIMFWGLCSYVLIYLGITYWCVVIDTIISVSIFVLCKLQYNLTLQTPNFVPSVICWPY